MDADQLSLVAEELQGVDPMSLFDRWYKIALNVCPNSCSYFCLATANTDGTPSSRMVALGDYDESCIKFCTNAHSRKAADLSGRPFASACFYWQPLKCQIIVDGSVRMVSKEETTRIFHKDTFDCQVTAAALEFQSSVIANRAAIDEAKKSFLKHLPPSMQNNALPCPDHVTGYAIVPSSIEFFLSRDDHSADRIRFRRREDQPTSDDAGKTHAAAECWTLERLCP